MKLYHATPQANVESILTNGIDNRRRSIFNGWQATDILCRLLDNNNPNNSAVKTMDAIYMFPEPFLVSSTVNYPDHAIFEIDVKRLNTFYLVAFNQNYRGFAGEYRTTDTATAKGWAEIYWKSCIDFMSYSRQAEKIDDLFLNSTGVPFIPEILYFQSHIPNSAIKLVTTGTLKGGDKLDLN